MFIKVHGVHVIVYTDSSPDLIVRFSHDCIHRLYTAYKPYFARVLKGRPVPAVKTFHIIVWPLLRASRIRLSRLQDDAKAAW